MASIAALDLLKLAVAPIVALDLQNPSLATKIVQSAMTAHASQCLWQKLVAHYWQKRFLHQCFGGVHQHQQVQVEAVVAVVVVEGEPWKPRILGFQKVAGKEEGPLGFALPLVVQHWNPRLETPSQRWNPRLETPTQRWYPRLETPTQSAMVVLEVHPSHFLVPS